MRGDRIEDCAVLLVIALIVAAVFFRGLSVYASGKDWLGPVATLIVVVCLAFENMRLRKLLRRRGIDPHDKE